jgi:hypothetical protein
MQDTGQEAPSTSGSNQEGGEGASGLGPLDKDSALYKAAVRIQSRYRGYVIRKVSVERCIARMIDSKTQLSYV